MAAKKIFFCLCANEPHQHRLHGQNTMEMLIQSEASEFNTHINKRIHFWPAFMHSVNDTLFLPTRFCRNQCFLMLFGICNVPRSCAFENNGLCKICGRNEVFYGKGENGQLIFESTQEIWEKKKDN